LLAGRLVELGTAAGCRRREEVSSPGASARAASGPQITRSELTKPIGCGPVGVEGNAEVGTQRAS
jgi:hypothetical protein